MVPPDVGATVTLVLACLCGALAGVQGLLPCRKLWARYVRVASQLVVSGSQLAAVLVALGTTRAPGAGVYVALGVAQLATFGVLDATRELAFQLRAPFTDIAVCPVPAAAFLFLLATLHVGASAGLIAVGLPAVSGYCGHGRYLLRDAAPLFGGAVYAAWALYEHSGACLCGPWLRRALRPAAAKHDAGDDEERAMWHQHRVDACISAEALIEVLQTILTVCSVVFTATLVEMAARRRAECSGVVAAGALILPLLAASSATLAGRFVTSRLRDAALHRMTP